MLGKKATDRVTGFSGVIASVCFDLYGCIQAVITPKAGENGELADGRWFDVSRLEVIDDTPVMDQPDFVAGDIAQGLHGPADKPRF
jgi:hypothetical protein